MSQSDLVPDPGCDPNTPDPPRSSGSSYPISSPSFWDQAAAAPTPTPPNRNGPKRDRSSTQDEGRPDVSTIVDAADRGDGDNGQADKGIPVKKRARFASSPVKHPDDDDEPLHVKGETDLGSGASQARDEGGDDYRGNHKTKLSYLPNRTGPISTDNPHSYLANAEYAPNKFGDIGDYMRKKEIKVQTQNRDIALASAEPGTSAIFAGLSFYINGNTHPPMEELRKMILQRGGVVYPVLRSKGMVKFIIAPMLTQMKFKQFKNYRVVREGWIVDSCREGKLLDWSKWKLQVVGGWEAEGRKGIEGFLRGEPSQRSQMKTSQEEDEEEDLSEEEEEIEEKAEIRAVGQSVDTMTRDVEFSISAYPPSTPPRIATQTRNVATQSLIAPARGTVAAPTPEVLSIETITPKVKKAEDPWAHYHTHVTNEHASEALRNADWRLKNTAERGNEGGFIDGYYQNSRLHHLSTWKAELKVLVAAAQRQSEENSLSKPTIPTAAYSLSESVLPRSAAPTAGTQPGERVILHVDFDCFFVSCGLATRPHLRGKPSVVCHSQNGKSASSTSEIASASYEARAKGVKNGMSLGRARALAGEDLVTIPYEFETYKKFSLSFYSVLMTYADELQAVSVDEALIDATSAVRAREMAPEEADEKDSTLTSTETGDKLPRDPAVEIADKIRDEVRKETGCEVSIGIAHNILLAKLATRAAKPAGVYHLTKAVIPDFLAPLDVKDLPSIGYSTSSKIEEKFKTTTCGELLSVTKQALQRALGPKTGEMIFGYLRGLDEKRLEPHKERKSISAEMNYGIRFRNQDQAETCVNDLAIEVSKRLQQVNAKGRLLTLKLMRRHPEAPIEPPKFLGHGWCETFNRSAPIGNKGGSATDDPSILATESVKLLRAMKLDPVELRGVGIQITKLDGEAKATTERERESGQGTLSFGVRKVGVQDKPVTAETGEVSKHRAASSAPAAVPQLANPAVDVHVSPEAISVVSSPPSIAEIPPSPPRTASPSLSPEPTTLGARNATAGPSHVRALAPSASSDGIDPDFLAALPPELRLEVKRDHAQLRAASRSDSGSSSRPTSVLSMRNDTRPGFPTRSSTETGGTDSDSIVSAISPVKAKGTHATAHITKQLRPKVKTQLKASAVAELPLYGAWSKAAHKGKDREREQDRDESIEPYHPRVREGTEDRERVAGDGNDEKIGIYPVSELVALDIDPSVLEALPPEMQKEVVDQERTRKRQKQMLHRPADTSRVRAREREREKGKQRLTTSVSPSRVFQPLPKGLGRGPLAGEIDIPQGPTVSRPAKPKLFNASTSPEVMTIVSRWIESRVSKGAGPAPKDAGKVKAYLVKCMDPESGLGGVEIAVEVLKFMRVVIEETWEESAVDDEYAMGLGMKEESVLAGRAWWATWREFRDEVERVSVQRFGAGLRL